MPARTILLTIVLTLAIYLIFFERLAPSCNPNLPGSKNLQERSDSSQVTLKPHQPRKKHAHLVVDLQYGVNELLEKKKECSCAPGRPRVPVHWNVSALRWENTRHGMGGTFMFHIEDLAPRPQGFQTRCFFRHEEYFFLSSNAFPNDVPCKDESVRFTWDALGVAEGAAYRLNITHVYGDCSGASDNSTASAPSPIPCKDTGIWLFSRDDVVGQARDFTNNFGQWGNFQRGKLEIFPWRQRPVSRCAYCDFGDE